MYTDIKNLNREVTSAIELSMKQCEVKPQIGSLVGKEFGHALHSSTTNVSIRNAYSSMTSYLQDLGSQDTQAGHVMGKLGIDQLVYASYPQLDLSVLLTSLMVSMIPSHSRIPQPTQTYPPSQEFKLLNIASLFSSNQLSTGL